MNARAEEESSAPSVLAECHDLVVRYGSVLAVDHLSLTLGAGEVVAVLGPNGAGKTSTVETLEGYRRPASGTVRVTGLDPFRDHRQVVGRIGVMLQRGGVYPMLSPSQALRLFARYYEEPADPDELLVRVGLEAVGGTPWRHLSGGEQQRLSLALALVGRPQVAFLDEPTAGVDPEGRLEIRSVIDQLRGSGTGVLVTTHELAEAERLADRVVILHHGKVVAEGTPGELAALRGGESLRFRAPAGLDVGSLGQAIGAEVSEERPGEYRVATRATPRTTATLTSWLAEREVVLTDLSTGRSLEEVYLSLMESARSPEEAGDGAGDIGRRRRDARR